MVPAGASASEVGVAVGDDVGEGLADGEGLGDGEGLDVAVGLAVGAWLATATTDGAAWVGAACVGWGTSTVTTRVTTAACLALEEPDPRVASKPRMPTMRTAPTKPAAMSCVRESVRLCRAAGTGAETWSGVARGESVAAAVAAGVGADVGRGAPHSEQNSLSSGF
jgi:hypothetical protein